MFEIWFSQFCASLFWNLGIWKKDYLTETCTTTLETLYLHIWAITLKNFREINSVVIFLLKCWFDGKMVQIVTCFSRKFVKSTTLHAGLTKFFSVERKFPLFPHLCALHNVENWKLTLTKSCQINYIVEALFSQKFSKNLIEY